jgi:hypothetical protein
MYHRATSPPIEWHTNTSWASARSGLLERHRSNAGSTIEASRSALYRLEIAGLQPQLRPRLHPVPAPQQH